jgi:hypothetical protein
MSLPVNAQPDRARNRSDWKMMSCVCVPLWAWAALLMLGWAADVACGQEDFEQAPIEYSAAPPSNRITELQSRLDAGELELKYEPELGYLRSVLQALEIPVESQVLVFSKTSLQLRRISPRTPRAIYFGDDLYLGYCQAGDVLEVSAVDPQLGTVFYTLSQKPAEPPRFERRTDNCVVCHASSRTEGVPGHVVRSLYVDPQGHPQLSAGSRNVTHTTPIKDRWGGWYVTGQHGEQTHLGNLVLQDDESPSLVDNSAGQNLSSLEGRFPTGRYLTPYSDITALMVLEHQVLVHNRITKANYTYRQAVAYQEVMNKALQQPMETELESTSRRIQSAGDRLIEALLFVNEAPLSGPIRGTAGFEAVFTAAGPRDSQGRSLRDLEMERRMFRYPCSYLIYSEAFQQLPERMRDYVWQRLRAILHGEVADEKFAHLSVADRRAILEILAETHPQVPANWLAASTPSNSAAEND